MCFGSVSYFDNFYLGYICIAAYLHVFSAVEVSALLHVGFSRCFAAAAHFHVISWWVGFSRVFFCCGRFSCFYTLCWL